MKPANSPPLCGTHTMKTKTDEDRLNHEIENMMEAFLRWPLPDSVCCDLCATKQGTGRVGTNLLSSTEARRMLLEIVGPRMAELIDQREDMCGLITRLCRHSYKLGVRNKLTDDAMEYINKTDASNTPATRLLRKIFTKEPSK
jgi:hypothetical protein